MPAADTSGMGNVPPTIKPKWINPPTQIAIAETLEINDGQFGQYLVSNNRLSRYELFRALQLQDKNPGARIGECVAALGFLGTLQVERMYATYSVTK